MWGKRVRLAFCSYCVVLMFVLTDAAEGQRHTDTIPSLPSFRSPTQLAQLIGDCTKMGLSNYWHWYYDLRGLWMLGDGPGGILWMDGLTACTCAACWCIILLFCFLPRFFSHSPSSPFLGHRNSAIHRHALVVLPFCLQAKLEEAQRAHPSVGLDKAQATVRG